MSDTINLKAVREFVRIKKKIDTLETQVEELKTQRDQLIEIIAAEFAAAGIDALPIKVDGEAVNVYTQQPLIVWRKEGVDTEQLVDALKDSGEDWSFMVKETVNANTLQAEVRNRLADGDTLPPALADTLNIFTKTELRVKANTKVESTSKRATRNLKG